MSECRNTYRVVLYGNGGADVVVRLYRQLHALRDRVVEPSDNNILYLVTYELVINMEV
jgi:hypothetical protein